MPRPINPAALARAKQAATDMDAAIASMPSEPDADLSGYGAALTRMTRAMDTFRNREVAGVILALVEDHEAAVAAMEAA